MSWTRHGTDGRQGRPFREAILLKDFPDGRRVLLRYSLSAHARSLLPIEGLSRTGIRKMGSLALYVVALGAASPFQNGCDAIPGVL